MYSTPNCTIAFDASTQGGIHFNVLYLSTEEKTYTLAVDELAGGTAEDYSQHIIQTVEYLSQIYARSHSITTTPQDAENVMVRNISAVLSDRAIVNQCAINGVNKHWDRELHQLYCNVHPLETITRAVKKCLLCTEQEDIGMLFKKGGLCIMERVLLAMNKMRFNDKVGDPKGFVNYLVKKKLGKGILKRARGNRIHLYFKLAEIYVIYFEEFVEYLEHYCTTANPLKRCLLNDFKLSDTRLQFRCMAIFGSIFSRVWMQRFYVSSDNPLTHIGAYRAVLEAISNIEHMIGNLNLDTLDQDIFGNRLEKHQKVWDISESDLPKTNSTVKGMLEESLCVLKRQYEPYMAMDLEKVEEVTQSTRVHNMDAEEMVGLFSAAQNRAPNATMLYLSSKIKCTRNKTLVWLKNLNTEEQRRHIELATLTVPTVKWQSKVHSSDVHQEIIRRLQQKEIKRQASTRKPLEKKLRALRNKSTDEILGSLGCGLEKAQQVKEILSFQIKGRKFMHAWLKDDDPTATQPWNGQVMKKSGSVSHIVCYWGLDGEYQNGVDYVMSDVHLAADYLNDDLTFL